MARARAAEYAPDDRRDQAVRWAPAARWAPVAAWALPGGSAVWCIQSRDARWALAVRAAGAARRAPVL
eukprot:scaffold175960_cov33-Tisochrysis_lutea.AAC.2